MHRVTFDGVSLNILHYCNIAYTFIPSLELSGHEFPYYCVEIDTVFNASTCKVIISACNFVLLYFTVIKLCVVSEPCVISNEIISCNRCYKIMSKAWSLIHDGNIPRSRKLGGQWSCDYTIYVGKHTSNYYRIRNNQRVTARHLNSWARYINWRIEIKIN